MKIVYRIVSALLALCVIPAAYYLSFVKYGISAGIKIGDNQSLKELYTQFADKSSPFHGMLSGSGDFFANASVKSLMPAGICFLVFFAVALILSLVIFFFSVFSNKRLVITCLGGGGLLSMIAAYISFGRLVSPLLDGTMPVTSLFSIDDLSTWLKFAIQIAGSAIKIEVLQLTSATMIMSLIYAAIVIWGLAYILTEDESEKKLRRLKKANKKKA